MNRYLVALCCALAIPCLSAAQPPTALFEQALALEQQGRLAEAEVALQRARQNEPSNLAVLTELGKIEARVGKPSEAIDLLTTCTHLDPHSAPAQINLAIALADAGRLPEALDHASTAVSLNPRSAVAHLNRARVLDDLQRRTQAEPEFARAALLDSGNADIYFYWAILKRETGNLPQEADLLQKAVTLQPDNARAWFLLGQSLREQGRQQPAATALRRSVALNPGDPDPVYMLSRLLRTTDPAEASALFARYQALKAKESDVEKAKRLGNQAIEATDQQRWSDAINLLRQAINLCAHCQAAPGLHKNLGLALAHSGDIQGGIEELKTSLSLNGNDPDVVKALQILAPQVVGEPTGK